jgi:hypothetical protein
MGTKKFYELPSTSSVIGSDLAIVYSSGAKHITITNLLSSLLPSISGPTTGKFLSNNGSTFNWGAITWSSLTGTPITLSGYGITDAQPFSAELSAVAGMSSNGSMYYHEGVGIWAPVTIGTGLTFTGGILSSLGGNTPQAPTFNFISGSLGSNSGQMDFDGTTLYFNDTDFYGTTPWGPAITPVISGGKWIFTGVNGTVVLVNTDSPSYNSGTGVWTYTTQILLGSFINQNYTALFTQGFPLIGDLLALSTDATGHSISNLIDPTNPQDVVTKNYSDTYTINSELKTIAIGGTTVGLFSDSNGFLYIKTQFDSLPHTVLSFDSIGNIILTCPTDSTKTLTVGPNGLAVNGTTPVADGTYAISNSLGGSITFSSGVVTAFTPTT